MLLAARSKLASANGMASMSPVFSSHRSLTPSRSRLRLVVSGRLPDWSSVHRSSPTTCPRRTSFATMAMTAPRPQPISKIVFIATQRQIGQYFSPDKEPSAPCRVQVDRKRQQHREVADQLERDRSDDEWRPD